MKTLDPCMLYYAKANVKLTHCPVALHVGQQHEGQETTLKGESPSDMLVHLLGHTLAMPS